MEGFIIMFMAETPDPPIEEENSLDPDQEFSEDEVVYDERIGVNPYRIIAPPPEVVDRWKAQVDEIVEALKTKDREQIESVVIKEGKRKRFDMDDAMDRIENEALTDEEYILFAIAMFVSRERAPIGSNTRSASKVASGGTYLMEFFLDGDMQGSCIDVAHTVKVLADAYGISGDVAGRKRGHHYFVAENGRVVDPNVYFGAGFYKNKKEHVRYFAETLAKSTCSSITRKIRALIPGL